MKEKVQSILSWEERVSSCILSTALPGRCIVVAIPCGRHAWADHHTRFDSQSLSPTISCKAGEIPYYLSPGQGAPFSSHLRWFCSASFVLIYVTFCLFRTCNLRVYAINGL